MDMFPLKGLNYVRIETRESDFKEKRGIIMQRVGVKIAASFTTLINNLQTLASKSSAQIPLLCSKILMNIDEY